MFISKPYNPSYNNINHSNNKVIVGRCTFFTVGILTFPDIVTRRMDVLSKSEIAAVAREFPETDVLFNCAGYEKLRS